MNCAAYGGWHDMEHAEGNSLHAAAFNRGDTNAVAALNDAEGT